MANDIVLSQGIRKNLLSLQSVADQRDMVQSRLATGKKVNSALDNPVNFFTAAGLSARANELSLILDSMGQAMKTLEVADNGIKSLLRLIETAQGTARQALQAPSSTAQLRSSQIYTTSSVLVGAGGAFQAGDAVTVTVGGIGPVSLAMTASGGALDTVGELITAINTNTTLNPAGAAPNVQAYLDSGGKLVIEAVNGQNLTIGFTDGGTANTLTDLFGTGVSGAEATAGSAPRTATTNTARQSLAGQFEALKAQVDQLVKDTSYNGVNLLRGDTLKVLFNETNTTSLLIQGVTFDSLGLGLAAQVNGTSTDSANNWQSDTEINAALTKLQAASTKLRTQSSTFGSNLTVVQTRNDFTKQAITTLRNGADNLVLADINEEGANLLALQTRQQLSTQALSLASQSDQAVLQLFR
jgi:flagellin